MTGDTRYTKDAGHEAEGELRGEEREEPGRRVEARADLVLLEVVVQLAVVVVQQPGELVHLNLRGRGEDGQSLKTHTPSKKKRRRTRHVAPALTDVRFDKALEEREKET